MKLLILFFSKVFDSFGILIKVLPTQKKYSKSLFVILFKMFQKYMQLLGLFSVLWIYGSEIVLIVLM
jgi:hypothetical protein